LRIAALLLKINDRMNDLSPVPALACMSVARLIEWGRSAISQAGSFEKVRELRNRFEALRVYQRAQGAALDAVNAATQLRLLADRCMGEAVAAIDKAAGGRPYQTTGNSVLPVAPTYAQLGVARMDASRWQRLAAVPEATFEAVIEAHIEQQMPITTAAMLRIAERGLAPEQIREIALPHAGDFWRAFDRATVRFTGDYEWYTPAYIIEAAREVIGGIDLDPASSEVAQRTDGARHYYTRASDGINRPWRGRVWLNPPYSHDLIGKFVAKLCDHVAAGEVTDAIMVTSNQSDARWFHAAARAAERVCFTAGRVKFHRPCGEPAATSLNGSCLFYFGGEGDRFASVFGKFGIVYPRCL
jgi:phage N-6-adenine-methyltransferase